MPNFPGGIPSPSGFQTKTLHQFLIPANCAMRPAHITPLLHHFHTIGKGQNIIIIIIIIIIMLSAPVSI
jgi:hypothetical protein